MFLYFIVVLKKEFLGIYSSQSDQNDHFCLLYDKMPKSDKHLQEEGHHMVLLTVYVCDLRYYLKEWILLACIASLAE